MSEIPTEKCSECGKPATIYGPDPYMSDVYPEDGPFEDKWWCDECYEDIADDI